jgi:hypothetical protein
MINWVGLGITTIVAFFFGMLWYGPFFGKKWMKLANVSNKDMKKEDMPKTMILGFISNFAMVYVTNFFVTNVSVGLNSALLVGFLLWLGYIATTALSRVLWEKSSWNLYLLNASYYLVLLLVTSGLLYALN